MKYDLATRKNGVTILKVPLPDSESVVVNFFVKTGSRNEVPRLRGISHFLEHLLFKGTKKYRNAKILSSTVESIGADYNAATSKEFTVYYIKAAAKHLPLMFDVLTDMLRRPLLDPVEIEREKGVIIEEMRMYRDTPMRYIPDLLEQQMWPKSDLGEQIIGDEKTVTGISKQDILAYLDSYYINGNIILAIAGKYSDRHLDSLIAKYWPGGNAGNQLAHTPAPRLHDSPLVSVHYKKTEQAHLGLGFYGYDYDHQKNPIVQVLGTILGGGMSSRLFSEIRERRGLAYYVRMGANNYQDTGNAVITAGLRLGKVEEAVSVIAKELGKVRRRMVGSAELKKAKENIKGHITLSLEDSESRLEWFLEQAAFHKRVQTPKQLFARIDRVTPAQIRSVANELFRRNNLKLSLIAPYRGIEKKLSGLLKL